MKIKTVFLSIMLFLLFTTTVYAGDIPESYLVDDVQMFFGEVISYHNNKEVPSIEVSPIKKIKGDVKEGTKQIYNSPYTYGDFKVLKDDVYLFVVRPENNRTEIFDVTTFDTSTLKLKHVQGGMWERFEEYMNEGRYGVAKVEKRRAFDLSVIIMAVLGVCICSIGIINLKGNIKTVHWYNRKNITEENSKSYGKVIGIGTIIIGLSMILTALYHYLSLNGNELYIVSIGCAIGCFTILYGQFKYNKGIF